MCKFPFRIGCTSYVIPDAIVPNVELMADFIDDIELLFFEYVNDSSKLSVSEIKRLKKISEDKELTYSIHLPIGIDFCSATTTALKRFVEEVRIIYDMTKELYISGYILHLDGITNESTAENIDIWSNNTNFICKELVSTPGFDSSMICIENLKYSPQQNIPIIKKFGFSSCCDIGHLWKYNFEWESFVSSVINYTRIIHLHGVKGNKDHLSLELNKEEQLHKFLSYIFTTYENVLTVELFDKTATFESLALLRNLWEKLHC